MLRTVRLSGELGREFGKYHRFAIKSPAEAVRALCANFPRLRQWLNDSEARGVGYRVLTARSARRLEAIHDPTPDDVISICPVMLGAKKGLLPILLGAALIAASFFLPGAGALATAGILAKISLSGIAFSLGASMFLSGVSSLLTKTPKLSADSNESTGYPSYYFNGAVNTQAQGGAVPLGYGRMIVGGPTISAGQSIEELPI